MSSSLSPSYTSDSFPANLPRAGDSVALRLAGLITLKTPLKSLYPTKEPKKVGSTGQENHSFWGFPYLIQFKRGVALAYSFE